MRESAALNMPANMENSAVTTGLEKVSFHPNPKEGPCKECSSYHTIVYVIGKTDAEAKAPILWPLDAKN